KNSDTPRGEAVTAWLRADAAGRRAAFDNYLDVFLTFSKEPPAARARLATKDTQKADPAALATLNREAERLLSAVFRRRAAETAEATAGLMTLAGVLNETYAAAKRARALLDYDDLIHAAERMLAAQGATSWVLYKLDGGIDHVLIDEAQDTNSEQWRVVAALAGEFFSGAGAHQSKGAPPRTVFAVGDVKQSIFGFQGAEPAAFLKMRGQFEKKAADALCAWRTVDLTVSFRSVEAVLDAVDRTFAQDAAAAGVALDGQPIRHQAARAGHAGLIEIWPPVAPRAVDDLPAWKPPVERLKGDSPQVRLAGLIARRIARMIADKEALPARGRPIRAGDVMVLVRRRTAFVEALIRALKDLDIPVAGADRLVLTEHIAVMDLMALGRFLLLPDDDLTLAAVLKGPLFGFDDDRDLFPLAYGRDRAGQPGSLWRELDRRADGNGKYRQARDELAALLARADFTPPFELYAGVLGPGRGREKLLARLGPDADDPITVFLDQALSFERGHAPSLEGFLHWLESGAPQIKRDLEHGDKDAVRVMTVHGAKGLQAPVVFLPDTMQTPRKGENIFWIAPDDAPPDALAHEVPLWPPTRAHHEKMADKLRDRADGARDEEFRRLLYVAMTRAEDRLYVCGWRTRQAPPAGNWYDLIRAGVAATAKEMD
ncbi:MAG: double-strand break repair helicase AddA, partial [Alphaproteobacteria bacterium]|nr:double-strand break repair helicase AddA [Alphaproteobacteria bacterium]